MTTQTIQTRKSTWFRRTVLAWYRRHRRALPWRGIKDPYRILVSEIMLQQTQVDRVLPKYREFIADFPTLRHLAAARRDDVVRSWSGLGYNRRALNLHEAARAIIRRHRGIVPRTIRGLEALPGIGPYTARAIASFAFGARVAAIDTNQRRIIGRWFFGPGAQPSDIITKTAEMILPQRSSDVWNHGLMDFGALICRSRPRCDDCPVRRDCAAYPAVLRRPHSTGRRPNAKESFFGSNRYVRGRIIERLRGYGRRSGVPFADLTREFAAIPTMTAARLRAVVLALEREGFVHVWSVKGRERAALRS